MCGETVVAVSNSPQPFVWENFGLKLYVPEDALPSGMEQCFIRIKASLAGRYKFEKDASLVSAVFWLYCEPPCKFIKSITLEIQHCAHRQSISQLSFVKAVCSQAELPYDFKSVGGHFTSSTSYGMLELRSFSGFAIEGNTQRYLANVYHKKIENRDDGLYLYFVVTKNLDACRTAVSSLLVHCLIINPLCMRSRVTVASRFVCMSVNAQSG